MQLSHSSHLLQWTREANSYGNEFTLQVRTFQWYRYIPCSGKNYDATFVLSQCYKLASISTVRAYIQYLSIFQVSSRYQIYYNRETSRIHIIIQIIIIVCSMITRAGLSSIFFLYTHPAVHCEPQSPPLTTLYHVSPSCSVDNVVLRLVLRGGHIIVGDLFSVFVLLCLCGAVLCVGLLLYVFMYTKFFIFIHFLNQ